MQNDTSFELHHGAITIDDDGSPLFEGYPDLCIGNV